ncbi:hypothetical protein LOAG_04914 [Loa loa]|uniref:Uncharacterized protein n=1 Tax=Loa loa TaxID=7209 RepID=A0A1S0U156_LOALO|nr:hypothetical protein LOAG_04914 [Loa loa]EFO23573.2 hypothetical protein LOAG_04914 [Loa loa]
MALQPILGKELNKFVPSHLTFDAKINIPAQMLRQEECRVPFIVANGPRSIELLLRPAKEIQIHSSELKINVADFCREKPTLLVNCQNELHMQISGLIAIRFGASKDPDNSAAIETILNETQETDFEHTFIMRGMDPFLESLHNTVTSAEYGNGLVGLSILITYPEAEFMQFVEQKGRLRSLTHAERRNSQLNSKAYKDFTVFGTNAYSIMYSKWMLYMSTKYFHHLIDENPTVNHTTLNYHHDVIGYALSLALQNQFYQELKKDIRKMRQTIELLCILEPINVDIAIEAVAIELESAIFDGWKYIDLDDLVRILTLPKYWELEELKVAARSLIIDLHCKQFQEEYNEQSTGARCAVYRDLILNGALDEISKPVESELEKIKKMGWKMSMVRKTWSS